MKKSYLNYLSKALCLFLLLVGIGEVKGQIFTEQFEYGSTNGDLISVSSGNWLEQSSGTPAVGYDNASLSFGSYPTSGGKATFGTSGQDVYRQFTDVTSGVLYAGFILKINTVKATGDYFAHFSNNSTFFHGRIFARAKSGGYELGLAKGGSGGTTALYNSSSTTLTLGTTYFVVLKYDFGTNASDVADDVATLFVFDSSVPSTEPATFEVQATAGTGTLTELRKFAIRQGSSSNAPSGEIDYVRVGTTWAEVTSASSSTATITVSPPSLSGFSTTVGSPSSSQNYSLSGANLTPASGNITVTAPTDFEVSLDNASFSASVSVPYNSGTLSATTIYVRIAASAPVGAVSGNVSNAGGGASTENVAVSGTVNPITPTLSVSPSSLSGFSTTVGSPSASQNYSLSGVNLTPASGNITVTAPTDFEVSLDNTSFSASVSVPYNSGTLSATTIYVRIAASAPVGAVSGNVSNAGGGASTQNVAVSGTVNPATPTLSVSPSSLSGFSTTVGSPSASQNYSLSGVNLTPASGNITVTAPTDFEVSLDNTSFSASVSVPYNSGTLSATTIYVRIAASAPVGAVSGNVSNAGGGASTQNVAVSGTVNPAPTVTPIANIRNALDANLAQTAPFAVGTNVIVRGVLHGVNRNVDSNPANGTKQRFEFALIDNSSVRNGITIRLNGTVDVAPIDLAEGDSVEVAGTVGQFRGLTQVNVTTITRLATGRPRKTPVTATAIGENEESNLIRLDNVTVTSSAWPATPHTGTGFNINITVGSNTYVMRITSQSELFNKTYAQVFGASEPTTGITIIGIGGQFGNTTAPFNTGYQIFPYRLSDIIAPVPVVPEIGTNAPSAGFDFGTVRKNEVSSSKSYKLKGKDLPTTGSNTNTVVTAPANFQVSKDNVTFSEFITFTNAEVMADSVSIFVRFAPTSETNGFKAGNITNAVPATSPTLNINVAVQGTQEEPLSIDNEFAAQTQVYPNPASKAIQINTDRIYQVKIKDITGRTIGHFASNEVIDIQNLSNGLYFLQFSNENVKFVKRLTIQK